MRRLATVVLAAACFLSASQAHSADSVISGRGLTNKWLPDLETPCERSRAADPAPLPEVCMDAWFVWEISVSRTIAGPLVKRRVRAANVQHAEYVLRHLQRDRLFLLRPIDDPAQRALLKTDYRIVDMSTDECLHTEPQGLGPDAAKVRVSHGENGDLYCLD